MGMFVNRVELIGKPDILQDNGARLVDYPTFVHPAQSFDGRDSAVQIALHVDPVILID